MFEELSEAERERYGGYWHLAWFRIGFEDYQNCTHTPHNENSVDGQAYDRGAELAMRRGMEWLRAHQENKETTQ
jgi:hypothetical protein